MKRAFSGLFLFMVTATALQAATINHNISTGHLVIQGNSADDYYVTGTTITYQIIVGSGYNGTITLNNVTITTYSTNTHTALCGNGTNIVTTASCMAIMGLNNQSNLNPVTYVKLVLEGTNKLTCNVSRYCGIQVDQGAQIHISAIDPNNNGSGILEAKSPTSTGGAGIGAIHGGFFAEMYNGDQGIGIITTSSGDPATSSCAAYPQTGGGNVVISSGTIFAQGGHSAGIGGGFRSFYNGVIIITGGIVDARSRMHAAGIGSGCPTGSGVVDCFAENSAIIVLPPAQITAYGVAGTQDALDANLGLAGTKFISYVNDPAKPLITVRTDDYEPNAPIYIDLTQTPGLQAVFSSVYPTFELNKVKIGSTNSGGTMQFHGLFQNLTTFFTTSSSTNPANFGRPYLPVDTTLLIGGTVVLPLLNVDLRFTDLWAYPLEVGYSPQEALDNAYRLKVEYYDATPFTNVSWSLQEGTTFNQLIFLDADGETVISPPTVINQNDVFYVKMPIIQGMPLGYYNDVLLMSSTWSGVPLSDLRKIGRQRVVFNDSYTNDYICVSASPISFSEPYPSSNTVTLSLSITHYGMNNVPYDPEDVLAWYYLSTSSTYEGALAEKPHYEWTPLNIPLTNGGSEPTYVSFSGVPEGTYYIHWIAESGVAYAHSLDVTSIPRTCGGFGPYRLSNKPNVLTVNPHLRSFFVH